MDALTEEIQKLRTDLKGALDAKAVEQAQRIEGELNKKVDEKIAATAAAAEAKTAAAITAATDPLKKQIEDGDSRFRAYVEKSSRMPGSNGNGLIHAPSAGRAFIESDTFKSATWAGRVSLATTLKSRMVRPEQKAVTTIIEGGPTVITPPVGGFPILPVRVGLIPQPFPRTVMRDVVPVIPLDASNAVEYVQESWTLAADYQVNEGDRKAQSGVTYTDHTATVRTIAHFVKVSRQMSQDAPFIMTAIDTKLVLGIALKEDYEILYGNNAAGHLWGIMPQATPPSTFWGTPPAGSTSLDEINAAVAYIESQYYSPTAIVMNPVDASKLQRMKNTYGGYIMGTDTTPLPDGVGRLWGLPVVTTPQMAAGSYLVGAFPGNCALFDRETTTVEVAFQNEDDFVRNLITIRAEERITFAVFAPKAFVGGAFVTAPGNVPGVMMEPEAGTPAAAVHAQHKPENKPEKR